MFHLLPEECLFIIIQYILDDNKHLEDAINTGTQNLQKSWKSICKHQHPLTPFNFKSSHYAKMIGWEKAPFTRIIPLMKVLPNVFNTNTMWTYLIEQEFRNKKRYKRKPKDAKIIFKKKVQDIIHKRYIPLVCKEEELLKEYHAEYIKTLKQLHILHKAIQSVKPQIPDISKLDELNENDQLPPLLPVRVKVPEGFIGRWNVVLQWDCFYDMIQLSQDLAWHERNAKRQKKCHDTAKKNIHQFKKIVNQVMEEQVV